MIKELTDYDFDSIILKSKGDILVDFWASWCGPCRALGPIMEEIANDGNIVYKVNVDDNPALARQYGIMSIPCVIHFKDGQEANKIVGLHSKDEILELLK